MLSISFISDLGEAQATALQSIEVHITLWNKQDSEEDFGSQLAMKLVNSSDSAEYPIIWYVCQASLNL